MSESQEWNDLHKMYLKCVNSLGELMQTCYAPRTELHLARKQIVELKAENEQLREQLQRSKEEETDD